MGDILSALRQARTTAWNEGMELDRLWQLVQLDPSDTSGMNQQVVRVDQAIERLRDALTLDGHAPRPTVAEAQTDIMRWGVDEGLIGVDQYDEWVKQQDHQDVK